MLLDNWPTLNDQPLPAFACRLDKKPMTKNGHKDATTDSAEFIARAHLTEGQNFLYGVPTGQQTGFDILDIDQIGFSWLAELQDWQISQCRCHRTRSGGVHIFFKHHPDLRNSASKIAPGVDVRAEGGYIIWWPSTGLKVIDPTVINSWPEWLVNLQIRRNAKDHNPSPLHGHLRPHESFGKMNNNMNLSLRECLERLAYDEEEKDIIEEIYQRLMAQMRSEVTMQGGIYTVAKFSPQWTFAIYASVRTMTRVGAAEKGERNNILNAEAYALGRIFARAWTPPRNLIRALWRGALKSGLVYDDGIDATVQTILSGLTAGSKNPYPDLEKKSGEQTDD